MAHGTARHRARRLGGFIALLALALGLAGLAVPAARLRSFLDLPAFTGSQIFSLDAWIDVQAIMALISRTEEEQRRAELERARAAAEEAARTGGSPVAYIVVSGAHLGGSGRGGSANDRTPPTTPQTVHAAAVSDTSIEVTWSPSDDDDVVLGYEVVREGTAPFTANETRLADSGLRAGTTYCYRVIAMDGAGNRSAESAPACATTQDILPPTVPGRPVASIQPPSTVVLTWDESVDDAGQVSYEVLDGDTVLATVTQTTWTHVGAEPRRHRYSVRAVDGAGHRSVQGALTLVALGDLQAPTPPTDVQLTPISPSQIAVRWTASTDDVGVDHYEVRVNDEPVVRSSSTSAVASPLTEWELHCMTIVAVDAAGNRSEPSTRACGRTIEAAVWKTRNEQVTSSLRRRN